MNNKELSKIIFNNVGSGENIISVENCMTRLRMLVKDINKVNIDILKNTESIIGVINNGNYLQIILGPEKVRDVMDIFINEYKINENKIESSSDWKDNKSKYTEKQKGSKIVEKFRIIADIFTPMIPAFIASGICNGLGKIIDICIKSGVLPKNSITDIVMHIFVLIGNAFLAYMTIFTGISAAKQFKLNIMLGGMIGAACLNPTVVSISKVLGWYNEKNVNDSILSTGAGGIIGIVVGVYILSKIEKFIHKHMPSILDISFTPLLAMLVGMPIFVLVVMPITGWLSTIIASFLNIFIHSNNIWISMVTGYIVAAFFLPLVLVGLHRGLVPIYTLQIEKIGGTTLFPAAAMAGVGQVGAAIALYVKAKKTNNHRLRKVIAGALPAGFLGIGEPLIYGVTLPLVKPFITAGLGAGFGGAYVMLMHVMSTSYSPSGILALSHVIPTLIIHFLIGYLIACICSFIITYIFISNDLIKEYK